MFRIETISEELEAFCKREITLCENAVGHAKAIIGDTSIVLDYLYHPRPLGLAGFLLKHGFHVTTVYLDSVSPEEKNVFDWLKIHHPDLELCATIQQRCVSFHAIQKRKFLPLGRKPPGFPAAVILLIWCRVVVYGALMGFEGLWN